MQKPIMNNSMMDSRNEQPTMVIYLPISKAKNFDYASLTENWYKIKNKEKSKKTETDSKIDTKNSETNDKLIGLYESEQELKHLEDAIKRINQDYSDKFNYNQSNFHSQASYYDRPRKLHMQESLTMKFNSSSFMSLNKRSLYKKDFENSFINQDLKRKTLLREKSPLGSKLSIDMLIREDLNRIKSSDSQGSVIRRKSSDIMLKKMNISVELPDNKMITLFLDPSSMVAEVIRESFKLENNSFKLSSAENYYVESKGQKLNLYDDLKSCGITNNTKLSIVQNRHSRISINITEDRSVPKLTLKGYITEPSMFELCRMSKDNLSQVRNFAIQNEFGKVLFQNKTNLTGLNQDKIVRIHHKSIEFYPDDNEKPEIGEGLNKPAILTYYGFTQKDTYNESQWIKRLKSWCRKIKAGFVEWDPETTNLKIHVEHF